MKVLPTIFDADTHIYEPDDCFTRYLPGAVRDRAVHVREHRGDRAWWFGNRPLTFVPDAIDQAHRPGDGVALFEDDQDVVLEPTNQPIYRDPAARIAAMDAQEVAHCLIYPNLGLVVENEMLDDQEALCANLTSYNLWLNEEWGFCSTGRMFAAPVLSLCDKQWAVEELDRVLTAGARTILLRPGPLIDQRSPADPYYDDFWRLLDTTRVPVIFHITQSGYTRWYGTQWGEHPAPSHRELTPFQAFTCFGARPMQDMFLNLAVNNLFGRFPQLRVVSVENGTSWVKPLLALEPFVAQQRRQGDSTASARFIVDDPLAEIIKRHLYLVPDPYEEPHTALEAVGEDNVLFGSDFPHPEGLAQPRLYLDRLTDMPEEVAIKIMGLNARDLLDGPA
ncbi:putative TIM-barrel fold metal-dependent hydrolase [Kibdelosporangium banguiense]|uniref:TIM-barrel fold metal-dependent hydrolase n=1 Tax=Kibdelosporangium banguiense TaxID=1365924 RepID=A0ABS4TYN1_9PSEU|nr:amidohydrolase family protein [Kibdelosporangium banguiense]MBP2329521.1 putative TIM-barrel fold metal-dependent hydrolase [Kibdelosporangium banguiense]